MELRGSVNRHIFSMCLFFIIACRPQEGKEQHCQQTAKNKEKMSRSFNPALYFEIPVTDMDRALAFYTSVFGFEFEKDIIHNNEMAFFPLNPDHAGITGALAKGEIYKPTLEGTLIYLHTDDIEKTLELAVQNGAEILFPMTSNGDWGYVAEFKDSEGNRIALRQFVK